MELASNLYMGNPYQQLNKVIYRLNNPIQYSKDLLVAHLSTKMIF
jgi:hypothetical protein